MKTLTYGIRAFALCLAIVVLWSCASGTKKVAGPTEQTPAMEAGSAKNQIQEFRIQELDNATLITVDCSREPDFTVFKLNDPLRVVVDLANTELGPVAGPFVINNNTVNEVNTTQFDDSTSSIARLIIGFDQIVDYEVVPEGNRLKIQIQRVGAPLAGFQEIAIKGAVPEGIPSETPPDSLTAPETVSEAPVSGSEEISGPVGRATQVTDVQMEKTPDGLLTISFLADGPIENYSAFAVDNPARLVVDFPGLTSGYTKKTVEAEAPLKNIRFGSHEDKLRIVLDSKSKKSLPEFSTEILGDRLVVKVGQGAKSGDVASSLPAEGALSEQPESTTESFEEPVSPTGEVIKIEGLDFKQLPQASRILIKVPESVTYESMPFENGKVKIDLAGVRLPKSLQRSLDTSEFDSAVTLISAYPVKGKSGVVRLEVSLREDVPMSSQRENGVLNFDFERTRVFVSAPAAPDTATAPPVALEPGTLQEEPTALAEEKPIEAPAALPDQDLSLAKESADASLPPLLEEKPGKGTGMEAKFIGAKDSGLGGDFGSSSLGGLGEGGDQQFSGRRISLDFKDADIQNIFRLIADISKLNIIVGENVQGKVTVRLINVPWDQVLAIVLQTKKLGIVRYDNILRIAPLTELEQERKEALSAKLAEQDLEDLQVLVLPINYTPAQDLQAKITNLLSKRGRLTIDSRTNTIILEDVKDVLYKTRDLIKTLDTATAQVVIDGRIVSAVKSWQRSLGIQWGGHYQATAATGNPTGLAFPANVGIAGGSTAGSGTTPTGIFPDPSFPGVMGNNYVVNLPSSGETGAINLALGTLTGIGDLDVRLSALETEGKGRVISSPRIMTLDNIAANIQQGARIPYQSVSSAGTSTIFVDATLALSVTPHVTNDKSVFMDLSLTKNAPGSVGPGGVAIDVSEAKTQVLVKDGDTFVLGGVFESTENFGHDGLPWLRTIPVINLFFSNYNRIIDRRELLFFVTPRVVQQTQSYAATN